MKNVDMKVEGDTLTITIDLKKDFGPSASGKNVIVASTEGNQLVPGPEGTGMRIGMNIYKPTPKRLEWMEMRKKK